MDKGSSKYLFLVILPLIILFESCSLFMLDSNLSPEEYLPETVLIVADAEIYTDISARIDIYRNDISREGIASSVLLWDSADDCSDLKSVLQSYQGKAESGFFIGEVPPAWYEQSAFGQTEVFPSDLYYMDLDSAWIDSNGNGFYDSHTELEVDFYISRLTGSSDDINYYFDKLHSYRQGTGPTPIYDGAFIFKDDDWHNNYRNNDFGLEMIYTRVDFYQDTRNTTKSTYIDRMAESGTEYVYQWIHAFPPALFIDVEGNYEIIKADDIDSSFKGNFYNLFDCQAARFTVKNLASSLITKTDSCIAVLGSTKTGGIFYPVEFHKSLGLGACWGAAYKSWYNSEGFDDDSWYLGMIMMGDPVIRMHNASATDLAAGSRSISNMIPISDEEKDKIYLQLRDFSPPTGLPADLTKDLQQSRNDH